MQPWKTRVELDHQVVILAQQGLTRRAIARALSVSRNTVRKILATHGKARMQPQTALAGPPERAPRSKQIDDFKEKVTALLARHPEITAQRVLEELRAGGFGGGYTAVKEHVRRVRPPARPEPSWPTPVHGPGDMAESDWSPHTINFLNGQRAVVQVLNYILTWSRRKSFLLYERCDLHALMDGHVATFERFGGAAKVCKYDSQKPVVLSWEGQQPIYNPRFLAFATHYEFRPEACRRFHPNDKPKTERSFWEFEQSFLNGRSFRDLKDMRAQLAAWLAGTCDLRVHRKTRRTALDLFAEEREHLQPIPGHAYDTARVVYRVCSIDGFVSLDGNRYAVPYDHVTDILPVRVTQDEIFLYAADLKLVARHELAPRGVGLDIVPLDAHKPPHRGADLALLEKTFADLGEGGAHFFTGLTAAQRRFAGYHARQILLLRERYATADLLDALAHARSFGAFECRAIERILSTRASPRRLAEYVEEDTARKYNEPPGSGDTCLRDLDEYDRLPVTTSAKEPLCPDESSLPQTNSANDSEDTSSSSA